MKITELKEDAFERAVRDEVEAEWDGEAQDLETIINFSLMNATQYNPDGSFKAYANLEVI